MAEEEEALRVRDRLHGKWIYGACITVSLARRASRNHFWWRRRGAAEAGANAPEVKRVASTVSLVSPICRVDGVVSMTSLEVLGRCLIGQCRHPISNSDLAAALRAEKFEGVRVLRMFGSSVLFIFDNIENRRQLKERDGLSTWFDRTSETFEHVVAQWGTVIQVVEETMVPSSFEKGHVLIETSTLDRIDDRLELCVNDKVFPVRITEADTFLRGSRLGCYCPVSDCESQSTNEEECNLPDAEDHMVDEVHDHVEVTVAKDGAECTSLIREEEVRPSGGVEARSQGHVEE
ncbi:hypothetical protein V6N12_055404, partial [Hibiscus sabdariffa]